VQLLIVPEYNNRDIDGTEDGELMRLLEETSFALEESTIQTCVSDD
jgi:hypothetical protein